MSLTLTTRPASGPLLSVSYFLWPVGLQLGISYSVLCPWPPPALQAEISGNSKEQIPLLPEPRHSEKLLGFLPGQICKAWGMLSMSLYEKPETLKQGFSCVIFVCCLGNAGSEIQVWSVLHVVRVPVPERYKVLSTRRQGD